MTAEERKKLAEPLKDARRLLESVGVNACEGVNASVKRALVAIHQALFNLGEEEREP